MKPLNQVFVSYMWLGDDSYDVITEDDIQNLKVLDEFLGNIYSKKNGYWYN